MKIKKIGIGVLTGLLANSFGFFCCILIFSQFVEGKGSLSDTFAIVVENGSLGSLITLGAILNLVVFFAFLKQNKIFEARGVLLATLIAAMCVVLSKFG